MDIVFPYYALIITVYIQQIHVLLIQLTQLVWRKLGVLLRFSVMLSLLLCLSLRFIAPQSSMFMMYRHAEDWTKGVLWRPIQQQWVDASAISPYAYDAVIAAEDQRFFDHFGFDFIAIQDSIDDYNENGKLRGASTISQQVAKNLFLLPIKSFIRKGLEVWFTLLLETLWSKPYILTVYLNIAEFGDHIFGIEAASRRYFKIPAKHLTRAQAALLVATLPNPLRFKATHPSPYVFKRQLWILRQMHNRPSLHF